MKSTKIFSCIVIMLALIVTMLSGCNSQGADNGSSSSLKELSPAESPDNSASDGTDIITITLNGNEFSVSKKGVLSFSGNVLTIEKPGTYKITGSLDNAQLRVAVAKTEVVNLIFAGVSITNKTSAPIYIESADKVYIELAADTQNTFTDAKTYLFPEGTDKPNACIYSSEDLTINGEGSLTVKAYYNNGIGSKNDLKIKSGNISIEAANNALKGNQSVTIEGGSITVKGADGIKSDSLVEGEGIVEILAGTVDITAGDDGIQAVTNVTVSSGASVTVNAADKDINCDGTVSVATNSVTSK